MTIYTDGACSGNPGPGGFGVVIFHDDNTICAHTEHVAETTNNREELKAILWTMMKYGNNNNTPTVFSDSSYCVNSLTNWMFNWYHHGWTRPNGDEPENLDLIKLYFNLYQKGYRINLQKIPGHSGIRGNELADGLATGRIKIEEVCIKNE